MLLGKVVGTVWSSVKWDKLAGIKMLLVRPYQYDELTGGKKVAAREDDGVVCADTLDAGVGDEVVIAYGHAARVAVAGALADGAQPDVPIDAAVVAIVDRFAVG